MPTIQSKYIVGISGKGQKGERWQFVKCQLVILATLTKGYTLFNLIRLLSLVAL